MTITKRRRLKRLAELVGVEICMTPPAERRTAELYFNGELNDWVEDQEVREQIDAMISEGNPNANPVDETTT